jgi:hypothetical protein
LAGGTGSRKITGQEILNSTGITIGTTAITSGTVGRVLFEGTGNVVSESANLFWDNTNGRLGIGTSSPSQDVSVVRSNNGNTALTLTNANTGSSAVASLNAVSNTTTSALFSTSSTFANYGVYGASHSVLYSTKILSLASDNSTLSEIRFGTGTPPTERMRIFSTGNVLINTTTDAGFKLDVNGTARVSGAVTGTSFTATTNGDSYKINSFTVLDYGDGCRINYASGAQKVTIFSNVSGGGLSLHNSGNISIGSTATEVASAILNVPSTTQGFLPPRMTQVQRNAIASPAIGLEIYQTDATEGKYIYKSSGWTYIG